MIKNTLQDRFPKATIKRVLFKDYNFIVTDNRKEYHIKILNVNKNSILSINSKHIWEIKKGKVNGIKFKTISKTLIDMRSFNKLSNKVILFRNKPYKILKFINESEVVDISDSKEIFDIKIYNSIKEMNI